MSRLAPVEKLPLAIRKSVRDDWDAKKGDVEAKISEVLGTAWTIEVNPNQIYAYADSSAYAKENLGACIHAYFDGARRSLEDFENYFGEDGVNELNSICHAHVLTLDVDEKKRFSYSGNEVHEGQLRLLFSSLGSNIGSALDRSVLVKSLNEAPGPESAVMSFMVRSDIRQNYDPKIEDIRARIGELVGKPDIKLNPNFEENFAKLLAESKVKKTQLRDDWQENLGNFTKFYFQGLVGQLQWQKFEDDELLQEGFNDVIDKGEIVFRVVDKLEKRTYNEPVIHDGILYLQTTPQNYGSNIDNAAEKLVDLL
ncbi:hypothetical protein E0Z10_g8446 [Xylaria hypoxylon]|uniref:Uncharacterized protein n=1 Tax=Xylaria hypoxylon TaxID=37992 RepID=A0A4Z0YS41_9PEZI|nr:hypothetical protein E0Z10_g8446 [Xylaria hypoxylon]